MNIRYKFCIDFFKYPLMEEEQIVNGYVLNTGKQVSRLTLIWTEKLESNQNLRTAITYHVNMMAGTKSGNV